MRTGIILLTHNRPNLIKHTLYDLQLQTCKDFDLIISNSNKKINSVITNAIKEKTFDFNIKFRQDSNKHVSFRRFMIAKQEEYDRYLFLDDDIRFDSSLFDSVINQYEADTYSSWWCWSINNDDFYDRVRVMEDGQNIDYAGPGLSLIDRSIVDRPELFNFSSKYLPSGVSEEIACTMDDIWLTHVVKHIYHWKIKMLRVPNVVLGGDDDSALYRHISKQHYSKTDFYRDLKQMI